MKKILLSIIFSFVFSASTFAWCGYWVMSIEVYWININIKLEDIDELKWKEDLINNISDYVNHNTCWTQLPEDEEIEVIYNNIYNNQKQKILNYYNQEDIYFNDYDNPLFYGIWNKIDDIISNNETILYREWSKLIKKIDILLENKKLSNVKKYALNYLRNEINLDKEYILKEYFWEKSDFDYGEFQSSNYYIKSKQKDWSTIYYLWTWLSSKVWKRVLNLPNNIDFIIHQGFTNIMWWYWYISFKNKDIESVKKSANIYYWPLSPNQILIVYDNGHILYSDYSAYFGHEFLYIPENNKIIDIYKDYVKDYMEDITYSSYYLSSWGNTFTIYEMNGIHWSDVNINGLEYLTFDINTKDIVKRENILKLNDSLEDIKNSSYNEYNLKDFYLYGDEYGFKISNYIDWKSESYRVINNNIVNEFVNNSKYRTRQIRVEEISFKLYNKFSKEVKWRNKLLELNDWKAEYEEIPYIEVLDIK